MMEAIHGIYEEGRVNFHYTYPETEGPVAVVVVFPPETTIRHEDVEAEAAFSEFGDEDLPPELREIIERDDTCRKEDPENPPDRHARRKR
ncbi:MAG: hypothetical protein QNK37_11245 [Acidobacteriota bacterium]|nr:hypothetical protein [Acidobacteriota bacterium]